ncbi:MAG: TetR family transcriptional regulator [Thermoleophilaceae bacterium]
MAVPYPTAARELLRNTLLDAMRELMRERPWGEVSMADVASVAGVSRQTLYKEFGSRQDFAQAFVLREADRFLGDVEQALGAHAHDPGEALSAALEVFLRAAADDPFVRMITSGDGDGELLPLLTVRGEPLFVHATERLTSVLVAQWPRVREHDARRLADCVVRLAVSYAASPAGAPEVTAAETSRLLEPFVRQAVGS